MTTLLNKTLFASASLLSVFGLLLAAPQSVSAQEGMEEESAVVESQETFDNADTAAEADGTGMEMNEESAVVESQETFGTPDTAVEADGTEMEMTEESAVVESGVGVTEMESDIDSDVDYDTDDNDVEAETYSAPTYSNSPRALW